MKYFLTTIIFILTISFGCSNAGSIVQPLNHDSALESSSNAIHSNSGLLGAYELYVDPITMTADITPIRHASLGESYLISGMTFFTVAPCANCLLMSGLGITDEGYLRVYFDLTHPFEPGDTGQPPSGRNRLDLDIFDVALIVVPKNRTPTNYPLTGVSIYDDPCVYAAGYTKEINPITGGTSAYPYYLVVDDHLEGTNTFNKFAMGDSATFPVYLDLQEPLQFDLYLTFGYGASATFHTRLDPDYFNPEFNRKNAWKVQAIPPHGDDFPEIGNTWQEDNDTTEYNVTVKVWDWQHGVTSISDPPQDEGDIAKASDVSQVSVEIPGMTNAAVTQSTPVSGSGSNPADPLIFDIPIRNENLLSEGEYLGLVKVTDERVPPTNGDFFEIDRLIDQVDPVTMQWYDIPEFATYQTFAAVVLSEFIPECAPQTTVIQGTSSGIDEELLEIVRNQDDWETLFELHYSIFYPPEDPPEIDFDNYMLVAVFLGARSSTGYTATIDCVTFFPDIIQVEFTEKLPGPISQPAFTYPFHVVSVPKYHIEDIRWIHDIDDS